MAFDEVQFPVGISWGSAGGPGFSTSIAELKSGAEVRQSQWDSPKRRYDVAERVKTYDQLMEIKTFFIARHGAVRGFRFKDWLDYTSNSDGRSAPSDTDQLLGTGDGSEKDFQLRKSYVSGGITRWRNITKPVSGTVVVAVDGVSQPSGWSVNTTTGVITFSVAPAATKDVTAGFEFDVPVRFGNDADKEMSISHDAFDIGGISSLELVEIIDDVPIDDEFFYGGGDVLAMSADITISHLNGRALELDPGSTSGLKVALPNTTIEGGPHFMLYNSGSVSLSICDASWNALHTLSASSTVSVYLINSTWVFV